MSLAENSDETLFRETTERFWLLCLVTEVRERGIHVRLDPFQRSFRRIRADSIEEVNVTPYPATRFAGWHWGVRQTPSGNSVYRLRGDRGVEIVTENGKRWFIGSRRPDEFGAAIETIQPTTKDE